MSTNVSVGGTLTDAQRTEALKLVQQVRTTEKSGNLGTALQMAIHGGARFPGLTLTQGNETVEPFPALETRIRRNLDAERAATVTATVTVAVPEAPPAASPEMAPQERFVVGHVAAPVSAPPSATPEVDDTPEDKKPGEGLAFGPAYGTLTINHSAEKGTWIEGGAKHDGTGDVMTSQGQRWNYSRAAKVYYLGRSKGQTADMIRIGWAALALRRSGRNVEYNISNVGCTPLKVTSDRRNRHLEVKYVAQRQRPVQPGVGSDEPVSAPPADTAEVPEPIRPADPVEVSVEVTEPVQESVTEPVQDFSDMTDEGLLVLVSQGDVNALRGARQRFAALRTSLMEAMIQVEESAPRVAPVVAPVQAVRPVSAPPARRVAPPVAAPEAEVDVRTEESQVELWISAVNTRRTVARELRQALMHNVTHKLGSTGNRPQPSVYTLKSERKFKVTVQVPAGIDRNAVIARVTLVAGRADLSLLGLTTPAVVAVEDDAE